MDFFKNGMSGCLAEADFRQPSLAVEGLEDGLGLESGACVAPNALHGIGDGAILDGEPFCRGSAPDFGENVSTEMASFPHWYCKAYAKYVDNEQAMKFDQHLLVAAIAPRALLVEGFNQGWFDAKGEWLSCRAASPVWEFLGKEGLPKGDFPDNYDRSRIGSSFGYVRRGGQHGLSGYDWLWMLDFADKAFSEE